MLRTSALALVCLKDTIISNTVFCCAYLFNLLYLNRKFSSKFTKVVLTCLLLTRIDPDESAAWAYLCDLLSALQHLHSNGFVHLDLKPANVLMTASGRLKLGDFGLLLDLKQKRADPVKGKMKEDLQEGDPRYMAPELLNGEYGPAADVFRYMREVLIFQHFR